MSSYKQLLSKEYVIIYLIYFFVFFAIGSLDEQIPLYFASIDGGAVIYGFFLSALSISNIITPTISALLSKRFSSKKVTLIYFLFSALISVALFVMTNIYVIAVSFLLINMSQCVFNFSLGSTICLSIDNDKKAKFFAVRDIFLYGSIATGLALSGFLVKRYDVKEIISLYALVLLIPCLLLLVRKNKFTEGKKADEPEPISFRGISKALRNKNFILILIVYSFLSVYSAIYAYVPFLAMDIGLEYSEILNSFAIVTIVNVVVALFLSNIADSTSKKKFFVIDVGFDMIPIVFFIFTSNRYIFIIALVISALKDIFAPITFAYKFELFDDENGELYISLLESAMGVFTFVLPVLIGLLWTSIGKKVFIIAFVAVFISTITALFLPNIQKNDTSTK